MVRHHWVTDCKALLTWRGITHLLHRTSSIRDAISQLYCRPQGTGRILCCIQRTCWVVQRGRKQAIKLLNLVSIHNCCCSGCYYASLRQACQPTLQMGPSFRGEWSELLFTTGTSGTLLDTREGEVGQQLGPRKLELLRTGSAGTVSELLEGIQGPAARVGRVPGRMGRAGAGPPAVAPTCFRHARRGPAGPQSGDGCADRDGTTRCSPCLYSTFSSFAKWAEFGIWPESIRGFQDIEKMQPKLFDKNLVIKMVDFRWYCLSKVNQQSLAFQLL